MLNRLIVGMSVIILLGIAGVGINSIYAGERSMPTGLTPELTVEPVTALPTATCVPGSFCGVVETPAPVTAVPLLTPELTVVPVGP